MYDRILVPTDGSDQTSVVEHALTIAELCNGCLHTLHVVDDQAAPEADRDAVLDSYEREGNEAIERVEERASERDIDVTGALRRGQPHTVILEYAIENDIDLVVMGTHGRSGLDRLFVGSVTERVVRASGVPVLTVGLSDHEPTVMDEQGAIDLATRRLEDAGYGVASIPEEPYRESGTWIVKAVTDDDSTFNVHVNRITREARLAKVG